MYSRFAPLCFVAVAACGRLGFDTHALGGDDGGGSGSAMIDAPAATGAAGPRYLIALDSNGAAPAIAGKQGRVAVLEGFQGGTTIAGTAVTGQAMYASSALVWIDPTGAAASSTVLDSTSVCQIRTLGNTTAGDGVLAAGLSQSGATTPALGPCAIASSHQDGISIAIDAAATQALVADVVSSSFNIQTWYATGFADGDVALTGIYGGGGTLGTTSFPATTSDENPFVARVDPATHMPRWLLAVTSTDSMGAGPIDPAGDELCATGSFSGNQTVFGKALTSAGLRDAWVARFARDGTPKFVRALGSSAQDSVGAGASIVATSDGGCTIAAPIGGDVAIDSFTLPVSAGPDVIVRFDATGTATAAIRTGAIQLAHLGDRVFAALPCTGATCTLSDLTYSAIGDDIVIASLDAQLHATEVAALTGGAKVLGQLVAIQPDALAVAFTSSGMTTLGALTLSPATAVNALTLYGIAP